MASTEYHMLSLQAAPLPPRLLPLPLGPGSALGLAAVRHHFPRAAGLHYWAGPGLLVSLPAARRAAVDGSSGRLMLGGEVAFLLPFLDTTVTYIVSEQDEDVTHLVSEQDEVVRSSKGHIAPHSDPTDADADEGEGDSSKQTDDTEFSLREMVLTADPWEVIGRQAGRIRGLKAAVAALKASDDLGVEALGTGKELAEQGRRIQKLETAVVELWGLTEGLVEVAGENWGNSAAAMPQFNSEVMERGEGFEDEVKDLNNNLLQEKDIEEILNSSSDDEDGMTPITEFLGGEGTEAEGPGKAEVAECKSIRPKLVKRT